MPTSLNGSLRIPYLDYKSDTRYILWWLVHASNSIIDTIPGSRKTAADVLNTTGRVTNSEVKTMSKRVAAQFLERGEQVPSTILYLFNSVIKGQQAAHEQYKAMAVGIQDEGLERSNKSHKQFIDTLIFAFEILGAEQWLSNESQKQYKARSSQKEIEDTVFFNPFSALPVHYIDDDSSGSSKSDIAEVPLEEYRVVDGPDEHSDYSITIFMVFVEGARLRTLLHSFWQAVTHDHLDIAVAGVMSNMAIALVKTTAAAVFVESDGQAESSDSYLALLDVLAKGDTERAAQAAHTKACVNFREAFSVHIYDSLVDFVIDYQKNRTGKPTKRLQADLDQWNPKCNLQDLSADERLHWRHLYTMNWLYELVNVYSHIVRQEKRIGSDPPEKVTWSVNGPYRRDNRLFGMEDFASAVTTWAMQKPGTSFRPKILFHHVFQLRCIVDSFTVAQGGLPGQKDSDQFKPRPPDFDSRQAIDRFLDRHSDGLSVGFIKGADMLLKTVTSTPLLLRFAHKNNILNDLRHLQTQFQSWLGISKHVFEFENSPPSRFEQEYTTQVSSHNGLWDHSPFLCGVGLAEALDVAYRISAIIWNELHEPFLLMQLHWLLVKKEYLPQGLDCFKDLDIMFHEKAFHRATMPPQHVKKNKYFPGPAGPQARALSRSATNLEGWLSLEENFFVRSKPNVLLYQEFDWRFWCIPEDKMIPSSLLGSLRMIRTKHTIDPETGEVRFEDTDLIKNARLQTESENRDDAHLLCYAEVVEKGIGERLKASGSQPSASSLGFKDIATSAQNFEQSIDNGTALSTFQVWAMLEGDVFEDICSRQPLCGFNYLWLATIMLATWTKIEDKLKSIQSPLYNKICQIEDQGTNRRVGLIEKVFRGSSQDHRRCAEAIAKALQQVPVFRANCTYWEVYYCYRCGKKDCNGDSCKIRVDLSKSGNEE